MTGGLLRISRVITTFGLLGWIAGGLIIGSDTFFAAGQFPSSLLHTNAVHSAVAAAVAGLIWSPLFIWRRSRWHVGCALGLIAGLCAMYLLFFFWPPEMQDGRLGAWKTAGVFFDSYWRYVVPASILGGCISAEWTRRPTYGERS